MASLLSKDLHALTTFLGQLYQATTLAQYIESVLHGLKKLVACDYASYNEIDLVTKHTVLHSHGIDSAFHLSMQPIFKRHMLEHPWAGYVTNHHDTGVVMLSDFLSDRQLQRLGLYQEYYRQIGVRRQLGSSLSVPPSTFIPVTITRGGRDFSRRDREVLTLLHPHLLQAFHNARAWSRLTDALRDQERLARAFHRGVVEVNLKNRVVWASDGAMDLLLLAYPDTRRDAPGMPDEIQSWLSAMRNRREADGTLAHPLTCLSRHTREGVVSLRALFREERTFFSIEYSPYHLPSAPGESIGLSSRESQVLSALMTGASNLAIGQHLGISARTVQKHLERIYVTLGVETRTAAVARAKEICAHASD